MNFNGEVVNNSNLTNYSNHHDTFYISTSVIFMQIGSMVWEEYRHT